MGMQFLFICSFVIWAHAAQILISDWLCNIMEPFWIFVGILRTWGPEADYFEYKI